MNLYVIFIHVEEQRVSFFVIMHCESQMGKPVGIARRVIFDSNRFIYTAKRHYRKFKTNVPRKGIARPQSQFPFSCVCERFIYSHDQSLFCCRKICGPILRIKKSLTDTWMLKLGLRPRSSFSREYITGFRGMTPPLECTIITEPTVQYFFSWRQATQAGGINSLESTPWNRFLSFLNVYKYGLFLVFGHPELGRSNEAEG